MSEKISDDELISEIKDGKTINEIKNEYGFREQNSQLIARVQRKGFEKLRKIRVDKYGNGHVHIKDDKLEEAEEKKPFGFGDKIFYSVEVTNGGNFLVKPMKNQLVKKE